MDEELIKDAVNHTLLTHFLDKKGLAAAREKLDNDLVRAQIAQLKAENAELRADEISRAMARAKATAKATPRERYAANPQFCNAISNLIDTIGRYEEDVEDFKEFLNSIKRRTYPSPTQCVETIARWPRLRKYWPRLRRRICSYCGKGTFELSAPRLLVCGGCDQGRGVGRYCSEDCQRAHWPEHQKKCPAALLATRADFWGFRSRFEDMAEAAGCTVEEVEEACLRGFRRSSACGH